MQQATWRVYAQRSLLRRAVAKFFHTSEILDMREMIE